MGTENNRFRTRQLEGTQVWNRWHQIQRQVYIIFVFSSSSSSSSSSSYSTNGSSSLKGIVLSFLFLDNNHFAWYYSPHATYNVQHVAKQKGTNGVILVALCHVVVITLWQKYLTWAWQSQSLLNTAIQIQIEVKWVKHNISKRGWESCTQPLFDVLVWFELEILQYTAHILIIRLYTYVSCQSRLDVLYYKEMVSDPYIGMIFLYCFFFILCLVLFWVFFMCVQLCFGRRPNCCARYPHRPTAPRKEMCTALQSSCRNCCSGVLLLKWLATYRWCPKVRANPSTSVEHARAIWGTYLNAQLQYRQHAAHIFLLTSCW